MLSEAAKNADIASGYTLYPLKLIYADPNFNCRGRISIDDVVELMKDINHRGLLEPIIIRPLWGETELAIMAKGYQYSLVAGFRRFFSYKCLEAEQIPANLRVFKSEFECKDVNAVENLQRKDLTFWQECISIKHYWLLAWRREDIASRINKSSGWVQIRTIALEMEPEIQELIQLGYLLPSDMLELNKYHGEERLKAAATLRDLRKKNVKAAIRNVVKKDKANTKKARNPHDIVKLIDFIQQQSVIAKKRCTPDDVIHQLVTEGGNSIVTRVLAWAAGNITTADLHMSIRDWMFSMGFKKYIIPTDAYDI